MKILRRLSAVPIRFWTVAGFFVASRLLWVLLIPTEPTSDFATYHMFGGFFSSFSPLTFQVESQSINMTMQPWGYPFVLGILYAMVGQSVLMAKLLNVVIGLITLFLLSLLAKNIAGEKVAFVVSLLFLLWPAQLMFTNVLASEHLALLGISATFLFLQFNRPGLAGVALGLATSFRFPCAAAVPSAIFGPKRICRFSTTLLAFALTFAAYVGLMYAIYRQAPITQGGGNLMMGTNFESGGRWSSEDSTLYASFSSPDQQSRAVAWERISSHPLLD